MPPGGHKRILIQQFLYDPRENRANQQSQQTDYPYICLNDEDKQNPIGRQKVNKILVKPCKQSGRNS